MKEKMKEVRRMYASDVRLYCIKNDLYTCGDCDDYNNMFNMFMNKENVSADLIYEVAKDIKQHSKTDLDIHTIAFELANNCSTIFFV